MFCRAGDARANPHKAKDIHPMQLFWDQSYEIRFYYQSTSKARVQVIQNLMVQSQPLCQSQHCENWKNYQSTSNAHANVMRSLIVCRSTHRGMQLKLKVAVLWDVEVPPEY